MAIPFPRLDAEVIRDTMLAISGQLNLKMYGRGFDLFDKRGGLSGFKPIESFQADGLRRMIYAHKVRREREAVFGAFDCPDAGQSMARRRESTTRFRRSIYSTASLPWNDLEPWLTAATGWQVTM